MVVDNDPMSLFMSQSTEKKWKGCQLSLTR